MEPGLLTTIGAMATKIAPSLAEMAPALMGAVATGAAWMWANYIKRHAYDPD